MKTSIETLRAEWAFQVYAILRYYLHSISDANIKILGIENIQFLYVNLFSRRIFYTFKSATFPKGIWRKSNILGTILKNLPPFLASFLPIINCRGKRHDKKKNRKKRGKYGWRKAKKKEEKETFSSLSLPSEEYHLSLSGPYCSFSEWKYQPYTHCSKKNSKSAIIVIFWKGFSRHPTTI